MNRSLSWFAVLLAGLAHALALAAPWDGQPRWWLHLLSMVVLARVLRGAVSWRAAAGFAGLFATAWLAATVWWLFISLHQFGGLPAPLAVLAVLALALGLALFYALVGAVFWRFVSAGSTLAALVFAALWTLAEIARGTWFTGFPWGAGGYTQLDGPLAAYAPWVGVYGVGAVATWLGFALSQIFASGRWQRMTVIAVLALPTVAQMGPEQGKNFGRVNSTSSGELSLALLQGNIGQGEKFDNSKGVPEALAWYGEQLRVARAALVIAPETAIPVLPQQLPDAYWQALTGRFATGEQAALLGIPLGDFQNGYTNSVIGLKPAKSAAGNGGASLAPSPGSLVYRYNKHHLVPFGEFIPPLFRWFTNALNIPLGDFERGALAQPSFEWAGQRLAPNICYEDLFGEELAQRFVDANSSPTILVNFSNLAWFGDTVALHQHLHISRMRALELARPMVRATNTGATVVIDHEGQVLHHLPHGQRAVLLATVQGRHGTTFYANWAGRWGLMPLVVVLLLVVAVTWVRVGVRRR